MPCRVMLVMADGGRLCWLERWIVEVLLLNEEILYRLFIGELSVETSIMESWFMTDLNTFSEAKGIFLALFGCAFLIISISFI